MKKFNNQGRKSTVTAKKIKELGVVVNPSYLTWSESDNLINIRVHQHTDEYKQTTISLNHVQGDEKAMFYAAAGIRNFIMRKGHLPSEQQRFNIIKRAKHTEKNKDIWYKPKTEHTKRAFQKEVELMPDTTEISISLDTFRNNEEESNKYKYINAPDPSGIVKVRVPYLADGKRKYKTKSLNPKKFKNKKDLMKEAIKVRDSFMAEKLIKPKKRKVKPVATKKQIATKKQEIKTPESKKEQETSLSSFSKFLKSLTTFVFKK